MSTRKGSQTARRRPPSTPRRAHQDKYGTYTITDPTGSNITPSTQKEAKR